MAALGEAPLAKLFLSQSQWQHMKDQITQCLPEEACGLLFGNDGKVEAVIPITNGLHSQTQFRMDPGEQVKTLLDMEARGKELIAIYHSHPTGPDHPSQKDNAEFTYPGTIYLIWSPDQGGWCCQAFEIQGDGYQSLEIKFR